MNNFRWAFSSVESLFRRPSNVSWRPIWLIFSCERNTATFRQQGSATISPCRRTFWDGLFWKSFCPECWAWRGKNRWAWAGPRGVTKTLGPICPRLMFPTIFNALSLWRCTKSLSPLIYQQSSITLSSLTNLNSKPYFMFLTSLFLTQTCLLD